MRKSHHTGKVYFVSVELGIKANELASRLTCLNLRVILKVTLKLLMEVKSVRVICLVGISKNSRLICR